ncbi:hypothetical protein CkaCkLH20_09271 [Colletotrichum karsti]|uniref:Clr5 domain-containing protein n=1 Tax=Colletotrichum karsti TaxID=1095194 RepID=A0A9P6HYD3_9PEZI|nr:uncharacterized protein CkaCkLH20_09271 [Colletotrichum karsti]KAF9873108.1 hypothetical protein CkaCkLH20_09271 [Colletotrichum karsti]
MSDELTNSAGRIDGTGDPSLEYDDGGRLQNRRGGPAAAAVSVPPDAKYAVSFASAAQVEHGAQVVGRDDTAKAQQRSATAYEHTPEHVIKIMGEEHNFSATERQYKRRFLEWKWKKYNSKGLKSSQLRGEQRFPTIRVDLTYANQLDQQIYGLYSGLQNLLDGTSQLHNEASRSAELLCLPSSGTYSVSFFLLSIRLFQAGDLYNGMVAVQRACRSVDNILQKDGIMVFQSLILEIPFYLLATERPREMQFFAQYLSLILSMRKSTHPIAHLAKMIHQISTENPETLLHHLGKLYELTKENYQDIREDNDFDILNGRMDALSLRGSHEGPVIRRYESALDGFAVMLRRARAQPKESPTEAIGREFCRIATTTRVAPVPLDPMKAYEKFLERFLVGDDHPMFLLTQPDPWILEQYGETKYLMFLHQMQSDNVDSAIQYLRECTEALECAGAEMQPLNKYMRNYYVGKALGFRTELERLLVQYGQGGGAAEVTAYFEGSRPPQEFISSPRDVVELLP